MKSTSDTRYPMKPLEDLYNDIDVIIQRIDTFRNEPLFNDEKKRRQHRVVPDYLTDDELLKTFAHLIAYSQNANSELVEKVLATSKFDEAFKHFKIRDVIKLNPCDIADEYWSAIKGIRQQAKLFHIVSLARIIQRMGGFSSIIADIKIPKRINTIEDIEAFWKGFNELQALLTSKKIPFFQSTTSLLHFLMEIGYDCIKPDLIVMQVAKRLQIVDDEMGDRNLRSTVKVIQNYSVNRKIRPGVVDLYFLIDGGQMGAKKLIKTGIYKD